MRLRPAALALCLVWQGASAAIVDADGWITDTASGLDWMDPVRTLGRSVNQVRAELGPGGTLEGWRYARLADLQVLFANYTGDPYPGDGKFPLDGDEAPRLISMWGGSVIPAFPRQGIYALLGDTVPQAPFTRHYLGAVVDGTGGPSDPDYAQATFSARSNEEVGVFGSFLVRQTPAPPQPSLPVPVPSTPGLVLGALAVLGWRQAGASRRLPGTQAAKAAPARPSHPA